MHLSSVRLRPEEYPTDEHYPFNRPIFRQTRLIEFSTPVTFFVGENGTGKSTLLEAVAHKCGIHIWRGEERRRFEHNPYERKLCDYITIEWIDGRVPGSFFGSDIFRNFAAILDEWAASDSGQLEYFGGKSLLTQSHGQSLMSYFRSRYRIKGLYFLDEPETALSPKSQLELLGLLHEMGRAGHAQFLVATHSPILLACPGAMIHSFDDAPVQPIGYEETDHYQVYKAFMADPGKHLPPRDRG
jgi:predicted ATPase